MHVVESTDALSQVTADVCVVGAGPVGLSLADDLARRGLAVVLIESGFRRPDKAQQALSDATIASARNHAPMSLAVCRALGGTSWLWGGRCVPLDAIDFEARRHVPDSGWPIGESDVAPFYAEAARMLGCGPPVFNAAGSADGEDDKLYLDRLERWCSEPNTARQPFLESAPSSLTVVLGATAVDIDMETERVTGVVLATPGKRETFRAAKLFVLACGGLETARLMLNVQARLPRLFGGEQGALGRYYMGHVSGRIADIRFADPKLGRLFDYRTDSGSMTRRRLTVSPAVQRDARIPNISFYPENPRIADPGHGSGMLSAAFLALSIPTLGRRLMAEAIRRAQVGKERRYLPHLLNIVTDMPATVAALTKIARQRWVTKRRKPMFFLASRDGRYPLHFHAEQLPNRESQVRLSDQVDALGLRRLTVDLRFTPRDAEGVVRAHEQLHALLQAQGIGALTFKSDGNLRMADVLDQATDGFHQMGLVRMGATAQDGVVDRDCRVFGVSNLFVAGSAVFRTSGQANPTFTAVALGLRLSAHLHRLAGTEPAGAPA